MDTPGLGPELLPLGWATAVPKRARAPAEHISDLLPRGLPASPEVGTTHRLLKSSSHTEISHLAEEAKMEERWGLGGGPVRDNREDDKGPLGPPGAAGEQEQLKDERRGSEASDWEKETEVPLFKSAGRSGKVRSLVISLLSGSQFAGCGGSCSTGDERLWFHKGASWTGRLGVATEGI